MGCREDGFESAFPSESGPPGNGLKIEAPKYALCWLLLGVVVQEQALTPKGSTSCWRKPASTLPPTLACPDTLPRPSPKTDSLPIAGIVKADPKLPDDAAFPVPPPRPKNVIFEDEEKSKVRLQGGPEEDPRPLEGRRIPARGGAVPGSEARTEHGCVAGPGTRC